MKGKIKKYREEAENWKRRYDSLNIERSGANENNHASELKDLKAVLRREAEAEVNAVTEQADQEIKELQESFNARVRETETGYRKQIDDLKKKMDSQEREIRSLRLESAESLQKNQSIANSNMDKMQQEIEYQYKEQIGDLERRLESLGLESAKTLEKELEKLREAHNIEMSSTTRRHKMELDNAIQNGVNSKSRTHELLGEAQINIEKIKEEAFRDKEEADEQIQAFSKKIMDLEDESRALSLSLQQADSNYMRKLDQSRLELDGLENQIKNLKEVAEVEKNNAETLKQDLRDKELYIMELGKSIVEYQKLHQDFDSVESRYKIELQRKDEHIAGLDATIQKERAKAKLDLLEVAESKHEAMDQLERIQRRLNATEQDLTRARSFSDEKESEILDMKRLIRSQNKQLETALGGPVSNTPKLSKDDLEAKVEVLKTQITSLKRQLDYKEKESFEVRMESAEAYQKASQLDSAKEEISRLTTDLDITSQTLIEIKSSKVQLLERVDNAEHRETLLKNEIALLKADIERNR